MSAHPPATSAPARASRVHVDSTTRYGSRMQHLPGQETLRALAPRYAALLVAYRHALDEPALIEPTGVYFPDAFALEADAVARLLRRMMTYAPLGDGVTTGLAFLTPEEGASGCGPGGCGTGGCAPGDKAAAPASELPPSGAVAEVPDGYAVALHTADVPDPTVLTACLARAVGGLVLLEAGEPMDLAASEISAAVCGFGLLLLNGACVYKKGCGGLKAHRATVLDVGEHAILTALFCRVHGHSPRKVRGHLPATQAEAFDEALRWVDGSEDLIAKLRATPELVAAGLVEVGPPKSIFARLFGGNRREPAPAVVAPARRLRSPEEERRRAEARAMVEDALEPEGS